jgi:hypothetical protein
MTIKRLYFMASKYYYVISLDEFWTAPSNGKEQLNIAININLIYRQ